MEKSIATEMNYLRVRRLRNGITRRALANKLGCHESWVDRLERNSYRGPARTEWAERVKTALDELVVEKRRASRAAKTG